MAFAGSSRQVDPVAAEATRPSRLAWIFSRRTTVVGVTCLFAVYCAYILVPILSRVAGGHAFGGDVAEYMLASGQLLGRNPGLYHYYFPVLPVMYLPLSIANLGYVQAYAIADTLSGLIAIALFVGSGFIGYAIGRSALAGILGASTIGTSYVIMNEIGWGGQAQMLSFAFGVTAIGVLLGGRIWGRPVRRGLATGVLLAAAALSESYAAAYFVILALAWCVLTEGRHLLQWTTIKRYWAVPVLPLVALVFASAFGGLAAAPTITDPILFHALTWGAWKEALAGANIGNALNGYCYALLLATFAVFALFATGWSRRVATVMLAALFACFVEVFLLTPAVYWDRAPYFVMFPLAIAAAALAPGLPNAVRSQIAPAAVPPAATVRHLRWRRVPRHRWVDTACAIVVVGVVVIQTSITFELYPQILKFYNVDSSGLSELTWLRDQSGAVLMVAPEGQIFPVSLATGRAVFPWTQPVWFDISSEQQAAILSNLLVSGRQWIDAGPLKVVDTGAPANVSSPGIFGYRYPYFVKLFDVTEGEGAVPLLPSSVPGLAGAPARPATVRPSAESFSDNDSLSTFEVSKLTTVLPNGSVEVGVSFHSDVPTIDPVYLAVQLPQADLRSFEMPGRSGQVRESFLQPGSVGVSFTSAISLTAPPNLTVGAPTENSVDGYSTIYLPVGPGVGFVGRDMNLTLILQVQNLDPTAPTLVSESEAITSNGIQWVLIDTASESGLISRFNLDPTFSLYWSSPPYSVYRVV
jgi:hypothetical protein